MAIFRNRPFVFAIATLLVIASSVVVLGIGIGSGGPPPDEPAVIAAARADAHVYVRQTSGTAADGRVSIRSLDDADGTGALTDLRCERFYFAGGRGVCLGPQPGIFITYAGKILDANLHTIATVPLSGVPSRARISDDGRYAAMTAFVSGHSYAGADFSTETKIVDATTGELIIEMEQLALTRDGERVLDADVNYWGVTFAADSNVFYATVGTRGQRYLVRGNIAERTALVIADNVECPSLSPDGTKIAFKRRVRSFDALDVLGRAFVWQVSVLNLADMSVTTLADTRDVDDQVEWLDDENVLYAIDDPETGVTSVWRESIDGGAPEVFAANAESPAVVPTSALATP